MVHTIAIGTFLLTREMVSTAAARLRQLGLLQVILVVVFVLLLVPVSYRFLRVGGVESADYDYSVSGDLSMQDVRSLGSAGAVTAAGVWGLEVASGGQATQCDAYFVDDMALASRMLPMNATLLRDGTFGGGGVVITSDVAQRLHIGVGDDLSCRWVGYTDQAQELTLKVGGVAYATATGPTIMAPESSAREVLDAVRASLEREGQAAPAYTIAYVCGADGLPADPSAQTAAMGERVAVETRKARLASEEREVQRLQGGQMRVVLVGSVALYLFLLLQHMNQRVTQNSKLYAILASMGGGPGVRTGHLLLDSLATVALLSLVGLAAASLFYTQLMHMYVPLDRVAQVAIPAAVSNVLLAAAVAVVDMKRLSKTSLAVVLSGE